MILGVSGRKQSGKDTIGKIINILVSSPQLNNEGVATFLRKDIGQSHFVVKKFADKLKDMVCMLIGCTREQLEDETFKNTELGEEWWYWKYSNNKIFSYSEYNYEQVKHSQLVKSTPRLLMQLLGTECGREILHPNIWVNSVFSDYKRKPKERPINGMVTSNIGAAYPNWIITDVRFPNEADAIKQRDGIIIRVNSERCNNNDNHPSEIALDKYMNFDYIISNDGSIEQLIEKVRRILVKQELL